MTQKREAEIEQLLNALRAKLSAQADLIARAKGEIRIRISRKGSGYQIDVTASF